MNEATFVIIKPDAIECGLIGKIIGYFEYKKLEIIKIESRIKNEEWFLQHYVDVCKILESTYLENMKFFMLSSILIGIVLQGEEAIKRVRKIIGATNCFQADLATIRGYLGSHSDYHNLVHAADSQKAVKREVALFFNSRTDQNE